MKKVILGMALLVGSMNAYANEMSCIRSTSSETEASVIERFKKGENNTKISLKNNNDFTGDFINGCPEKAVITSEDEGYKNLFDVVHLTYGFEKNDRLYCYYGEHSQAVCSIELNQ